MLTDEQIQELYAYCKRKNILYYDIQVEIVDHMANAIEEKMNLNPALSFKEALEEVHVSFGSFGLKEIVESKTEAMRKQYNKTHRRLFWRYFTPPKLTLTALVFFAVVMLERMIPFQFLIYVLIVTALISMYFFFSLQNKKHRVGKSQQKKLLMTDRQYFDYTSVFTSLLIFILPRLFEMGALGNLDGEMKIRIQYYIFSVWFIIFSIGAIVRRELLITTAEKAKKQYPAAFAS